MDVHQEAIQGSVADRKPADNICGKVQDENADHNIQAEAATPLDDAKKLAPSMQAWAASRSQGGLKLSAAGNVAASELSKGSVDHQASRMSRRRDSGISLSKSTSQISSEVLQQLRVDEARRQQSDRVRKNAENCQRAIHSPDIPTRSGSEKITVPHEFHLSVSKSRDHHHPDPSPDADVYAGEGGRDKVWKQSLREDSAPPTPSRGRSRPPELTVPQGPKLRTASRSCSRSSSVGSGMESACSTPNRFGTPLRSRSRNSSRASTPLPVREQAAVEEYLHRMAAARTPSQSPGPRSRRSGMPTPSPARSGRGTWTPTRHAPRSSQSAPCSPRETSISSRLSELSRRTPSRSRMLSSMEMQSVRAEEWRRKLHDMRRRNEQTWREAKESVGDLAGIGNSHGGNPALTVPHGPSLRTENRSSRSRSTSRNRSAGHVLDSAGLTAHAVPQAEQRAMEKHIERMATADTEKEGSVLKPPSGQDPNEWARSGATAQECAERARAIVLSKRLQQETEEKARLFAFKTSSSKDSAKKGGTHQKPNFVFKTTSYTSRAKPADAEQAADDVAQEEATVEAVEVAVTVDATQLQEEKPAVASEAVAAAAEGEAPPLEVEIASSSEVVPAATPTSSEEQPKQIAAEVSQGKPAQVGSLKRPGFAAATKSKAPLR
eukprot:TRINITY_DN8814_c0_g1_i1.p1 TRINITY_DN8814_c0_g1~~TRINITY_DN8814_c0_g1_i1.p1  ORF type:complete len:663 (+),score=145.00 TRINITY_DN8814_c0_g1_i1:115-2103(+)